MPPGIVAAVRTLLLENAELAAALAQRIYPSILPQPPSFPAVTIQIVGGNTIVSHGGYSGLLNDLVQIDTYSKTQVEADSLGRRIRIVIDGFKGTAKQVVVPGAFRRTGAVYFDPDAEVFRFRQDFRFWQQRE